MGELDRTRALDDAALDPKNYWPSLIGAALSRGLLSDADMARIQGESAALFVRQAERLTRGESTSLRAEKARELTESIACVLGTALRRCPEAGGALETLRREPLDAIFDRGLTIIRRRLGRARAIHERLKETLFATRDGEQRRHPSRQTHNAPPLNSAPSARAKETTHSSASHLRRSTPAHSLQCKPTPNTRARETARLFAVHRTIHFNAPQRNPTPSIRARGSNSFLCSHSQHSPLCLSTLSAQRKQLVSSSYIPTAATAPTRSIATQSNSKHTHKGKQTRLFINHPRRTPPRFLQNAAHPQPRVPKRRA